MTDNKEFIRLVIFVLYWVNVLQSHAKCDMYHVTGCTIPLF